MRIPRIFTPQDLTPGSNITLEPDASHHLVKVLRMNEGRDLILFNGKGKEYPSHLLKAGKKNAEVSVDEEHNQNNESPLHLELAIGLSKGDRFDWVLQKSTELGVSRIIPLFSERCDVKLSSERLEKKMQSWQKTIVGACEQCQRNTLPILDQPSHLSDYLSSATAERKFVLHHRSRRPIDTGQPPNSASLVIGPEGGLTDNEIDMCEKYGFAPLRLGHRVLRTETAPLAAITLMQYLWGDLS